MARENLEKFLTWKSKAKNSLEIPCRNHYGHVAYFEDHDGVMLIGFGDESGFEPDKDALKFDKEDLPRVIEFLQAALEREKRQ